MKNEAVLSAIMGFLFGTLGYFIFLFLDMKEPFALSVAVGLLCALLLFPILLLSSRAQDKKFAVYEKEITSPVFCKANGNFDLGGGKIRNGNIYFCEDAIVCLCVDSKPHIRETFPRRDIARIQQDSVHLTISTKDGNTIKLMTPEVSRIMEALRCQGWI